MSDKSYSLSCMLWVKGAVKWEMVGFFGCPRDAYAELRNREYVEYKLVYADWTT